MNLTLGQPIWQTILYFLLVLPSIWLFRAAVVGTLPAAFAFLHGRRALLLSLLPAALALFLGVFGVLQGIRGIVNKTIITEEYLEIRKSRTRTFRQKWTDIDSLSQRDSTLRLAFLEGGKYEKVAYLSQDQMGKTDYEAFCRWLEKHTKKPIWNHRSL